MAKTSYPFIVRQNNFHGGSVIKGHYCIGEALKTVLKHTCSECKCGGPDIFYNGFKYNQPIIAYYYYRTDDGLTKADAILKAVADHGDF